MSEEGIHKQYYLQGFAPGGQKTATTLEKMTGPFYFSRFSFESLSGKSLSGAPESLSGAPRAYPVSRRAYPVQKRLPNTLSRPESLSGRPARAYPGSVGGESLSGQAKLYTVKMHNPSHAKTHFPIHPRELIRSS